jgi:hypothetical protein
MPQEAQEALDRFIENLRGLSYEERFLAWEEVQERFDCIDDEEEVEEAMK